MIADLIITHKYGFALKDGYYLKTPVKRPNIVPYFFSIQIGSDIVGPDLGPFCFQRLSADDTSRQRVKYFYLIR